MHPGCAAQQAPVIHGPARRCALAVPLAQQPTGNNFKPDPARVSAGAKKSGEALCSMCHLGGLKGQNEIPRLAGQQPDYVIKQLKDFRSRTRTNDGGNMTSVSKSLSDDDITDLAHYIGSLY